MDDGAILYKKFLAGDDSALNSLVDMYGDKLMLFINSFVNNLSLAEEIMEDVFMELIVKKHNFKENQTYLASLIPRSNLLLLIENVENF